MATQVPTQVRFVVKLDADWRGEVTCGHDPDWHRPIELTRLEHATGACYPGLDLPLHDPEQQHAGLSGAATADEVKDLYDRVLGRTANPSEIARLGHYLFDAFLGNELWAEMEQLTESRNCQALELALSLPNEPGFHLQRINWELMRSERQFLAAAGPSLDAAITRIVDTHIGAPAQLDVPPRVLFVVGTALTEQKIRPGAELHHLLRQARGGRAMRYRLLECATPTMIRDAVREFRPEVVHVICHGGIDGDSPKVFLNLAVDEKDTVSKRYAKQVAYDLCESGWHPTVVVLSACLTGSVGGPRYVLAGPHETAPFAAELVENGIPIVLGMAGRVADITSRVFARRFGESLIKGHPLVLATAKARQVAFADMPDPQRAADWAFPAVFMAKNVPADYRPVDVGESDQQWRQLENWIKDYGLREDPVFCGRDQILAQFPQLFEPPGRGGDEPDEGRKRVLAVLVERQVSGYGRTRLLKELAAQALRDGHLPLLLTSTPRDGEQLLAELALEIARLRAVLQISPARTSQLVLLRARRDDPELDPGITLELQLKNNKLTNGVIQKAIAADLAGLLKDAQDEIPFFKVSQGQVVVLLDDVDAYGELVGRLLASRNGLLGPTGFGTAAKPVPVVMACSLGDRSADVTLKPIAEGTTSIGWLAVEKLGPFEGNGEDLLACQAVLLNPFNHGLVENVSGLAWAFDDSVDEVVRKHGEQSFRMLKEMLPSKFHDPMLYVIAHALVSGGFVVPADDGPLEQTLPRQLA